MTSALALDRALSLLVHAPAKQGKSSFSVTSPAPRVYVDSEAAARFLEAEGRIKAIKWNPDDPPPVYDGTWDTAVVPTRDFETVEKVYGWLNSGKHPFKSLIIDSISELQFRVVDNLTGRKQPTQQQWGGVYRDVGGFVRDIRDLTMHPTKPLECVVIIAMTRMIDNKYVPWCQGQLQTVLPFLLDATTYLYVDAHPETGKPTRMLLTQPTAEFEAGNRIGDKWPIVIPEPNISKMIDAVFGPAPDETPSQPEETPAEEPQPKEEKVVSNV
jgi:hypothetical protein